MKDDRTSMTDEDLDRLADRLVERVSSRQERRYLTLREAGEYCGGRSAEAMRMMARRGRFQIIKQGKSTYIDKLEIDRAMQEMRVEIPES